MVDDSNELIIHLINYFACIMCVYALFMGEEWREGRIKKKKKKKQH